MRGGYMLLDFENKPITPNGDSVKIDGIYERLESNHGKAILLSNLNLDGVEKPDRFVNFGANGENFDGLLGIKVDYNNFISLVAIVKPDDTVTLKEF